ncbi:MAG: aminomethyltransferase family protein [Alphaproteobacteria bacterium]
MSQRQSALADRHRALGAGLDDWNGMDVAWSYATDADDEHDAVRTAAGLFDVSGLRKIHVRGPGALTALDHLITRDMTRIYVGKSAYGPVLTEGGTICDDAIIFNVADDDFLVVHGSGQTMERLRESAQGKDVSIEFDDVLHDISLQGSKAVDLLDAHTPIDLHSLPYFHHKETTLFGKNVLLSRTGYSGERGYEVFCQANDVVDIWDQILEHGKPMGVMACSFNCLDKIRVEAGLLFYPYDMTEEHTPWEVGFGWAVSRRKGDFRGKAAVLAAEGKEKIKFAGIVADHDDVVDAGAKLYRDGDEVGVVNSPVYSRRMKKSLALVHVKPDAAAVGTRLELRGESVSCSARVERSPFYDPEKTRTHT